MDTNYGRLQLLGMSYQARKEACQEYIESRLLKAQTRWDEKVNSVQQEMDARLQRLELECEENLAMALKARTGSRTEWKKQTSPPACEMRRECGSYKKDTRAHNLEQDHGGNLEEKIKEAERWKRQAESESIREQDRREKQKREDTTEMNDKMRQSREEKQERMQKDPGKKKINSHGDNEQSSLELNGKKNIERGEAQRLKDEVEIKHTKQTMRKLVTTNMESEGSHEDGRERVLETERMKDHDKLKKQRLNVMARHHGKERMQELVINNEDVKRAPQTQTDMDRQTEQERLRREAKQTEFQRKREETERLKEEEERKNVELDKEKKKEALEMKRKREFEKANRKRMEIQQKKEEKERLKEEKAQKKELEMARKREKCRLKELEKDTKKEEARLKKEREKAEKKQIKEGDRLRAIATKAERKTERIQDERKRKEIKKERGEENANQIEAQRQKAPKAQEDVREEQFNHPVWEESKNLKEKKKEGGIFGAFENVCSKACNWGEKKVEKVKVAMKERKQERQKRLKQCVERVRKQQEGQALKTSPGIQQRMETEGEVAITGPDLSALMTAQSVLAKSGCTTSAPSVQPDVSPVTAPTAHSKKFNRSAMPLTDTPDSCSGCSERSEAGPSPQIKGPKGLLVTAPPVQSSDHEAVTCTPVEYIGPKSFPVPVTTLDARLKASTVISTPARCIRPRPSPNLHHLSSPKPALQPVAAQVTITGPALGASMPVPSVLSNSQEGCTTSALPVKPNVSPVTALTVYTKMLKDSAIPPSIAQPSVPNISEITDQPVKPTSSKASRRKGRREGPLTARLKGPKDLAWTTPPNQSSDLKTSPVTYTPVEYTGPKCLPVPVTTSDSTVTSTPVHCISPKPSPVAKPVASDSNPRTPPAQHNSLKAPVQTEAKKDAKNVSAINTKAPQMSPATTAKSKYKMLREVVLRWRNKNYYRVESAKVAPMELEPGTGKWKNVCKDYYIFCVEKR